MIPVSVPAGASPYVVGGPYRLLPSHALRDQPCPACDEVFGDSYVANVLVGVRPEDRKDWGWTKGGVVVVHARCAGVAFRCPRCGVESPNKNDIREGHCFRCHDWTGPGRVAKMDTSAPDHS